MSGWDACPSLTSIINEDKMKRKLLSVITSLILIVLLFVPVPASAVPALGENLWTNGGFESTSGFGAYGGWGGSVASLTTDTVRSGSRALKMNGVAGNPWVNTTMRDMIGGSTVTLTFWCKGQIPEQTGDYVPGLGIKFEAYANEVRTDFAAGAKEVLVMTESTDEWTKMSVSYTLEDRANVLIVYFRMYNMTSGTVYIDDAQFCISRYPDPKFKATSEQVFYYTDTTETEGKVTVALNEFFNADTYTASFNFMDGKNVAYAKENIAFVNNKAEFIWPLSLLKVKTKEYKIKIEIKNSAGETVSQLTEYAYKYDRPKALSANGEFTDKNGKVIKPVMNYHMAPFSDTEAWEAMTKSGINVVQYVVPSDISQAYKELDAMYEMGVYAAVVCYLGMKPAGHDDNYMKVFDSMSLIADHPAVFCWMTMDEPFLHNIDASDDLRKSYKLLRGLNNRTPVYICECTTAYMGESAKYCDIIAPDPYPAIRNSYGTYVSVFIDVARREAAKQNKLVMGILQCCTVENGTPTAVQVHSMILQNYLSGGKAHGWYAWEPDYPDIDKSLHKSPYWDALMAFHTLEEELIYKYYVTGEYKKFNSDKPGNIEAQTGDVWYETWTDGTDIFGIIQNRKKTEATGVIPLVSDNGLVAVGKYDFSIIYDGAVTPVIQQRESALEIILEPYQAFMFKVTPEKSFDTGLLDVINLAKNGGFEYEGIWTAENAEMASVLIKGKSDEAQSGENYISLKGTKNAAVSAIYDVEAGQTYLIEAYYKSDTANAASVQVYDGAGRAVSALDTRPEAHADWTKVQVMITAGKTLSPKIRVRLGSAIADAKVCFDSVTLTPIEHDYRNMIVNGGFEADVPTDREQQNITNWWSGNGVKLVQDGDGTAMAVRQQNRTTGAFCINNTDSSAASGTEQYVISFRVNDNSAAEGKLPWVRLLTYKAHNDASLSGLGDPIYIPFEVTANKWVGAGAVVTLPEGTNYIKVDICAGAGWTMFDDFEFYRYGDDISISDSEGKPVATLPDDSEYIEAKLTSGAQGRLYVAEYKKSHDTERLVKISCASGNAGARLSADSFKKGETVVKIIHWTENMNPDRVIILR